MADLTDGEAITTARGLVALLKFAESVEPLIRKASEAQAIIDGLEAEAKKKQAVIDKLGKTEEAEQLRAAGYRQATDKQIAKMDEEKLAAENDLKASKEKAAQDTKKKNAALTALDSQLSEKTAALAAAEKEYKAVVSKHGAFLKDIGAK